jgi:predicted metal-dependent hydrolase
MSTDRDYLTVANLEVDVIYKNIKNLHISVYPPVGRVRVAAPSRMDADTIRLAVVQRLPWIKKQRDQLLSASRQTERRMLSGESHYVCGQRYLLDVSRTSGRPRVEIEGRTLWVVSKPGATEVQLRGVLERWYRRQLKAAIPPLIEKWQSRVGVEIEGTRVRRMKTKWGTYVAKSGTIWLNLELAKKPPQCLEYIIVHEMVHGLERGHGERFISLMDHHMPDWRQRRDELNGSPLANEDWKVE